MKEYLNYIKQNYSEFRYISDKNILENLDFFTNINYIILSNKIWFCIIYTDLRISKNNCFFWFLEIYNIAKSKDFLNEIKKIAKDNLSTNEFNPLNLVWPINLSIWNNYRFWNFENKKKIIYWEYDTNNQINNILLKNNFKIYEKYITAKRFWKNPYIINNNFIKNEIKKINTNKKAIKDIYNLSSNIFNNTPTINFWEFEKYMQVYLDLYKNNINEFILMHKWKKIGFLSSFYNEKYFVIKTIWVLQEFRWKWLWNYLLSYVYDYYINLGFKASYYLYMREKWDALNMTHENAEVFREYFTYYIEL